MAPRSLARALSAVLVPIPLAGCDSVSPPSRTTTTVPAPAAQTASVTPEAIPSADHVNPTTSPDRPDDPGERCAADKASARQNPPQFSPDSVFNQPASCLGVRADSAAWSRRWFDNANLPGRTDPSQRGRITVSFDAYSTPIYYTDDATTTIRVYIASWGWPSNVSDGDSIPWNPDWQPAAGSDMEMVIIDRATGRQWGLWGVQKVNWSTCLTLGNLFAGYRGGTDLCAGQVSLGTNPDGSIADLVHSSGYSGAGQRGMGNLLATALLPTLDEIEKGSIEHVVNMETYGTMFGPACTPAQVNTAAAGVDCGYAEAPATRLEWYSGPAASCGASAQANTPEARAKTVPEGMRFRLNLTDAQVESWLDRRGFTGAKRRTARIFATAFRKYGWVISDTTCWDSAMAVEGIANPSARRRWADLGIASPTSDGATLLDGLITSADQVETLNPPTPGRLTNAT
ncbi:MAG: hypothetical protein R2698_10335 [Microthrixaceae bacterium]